MIKTTKTYNPWIDIASYQTSDAYRFKGREEETEKFLNIMSNRTMSVLYSDSGVGKTSFINAGIVPKLEEKSFLPIHIRFPEEFFDEGNVKHWLYHRLHCLIEENENKTDEKGYVWNSFVEENIDIEGCKDSVWWLFHTSTIYDKGNGRLLKPLVIFDQFEEVFVKSQKQGAKGRLILNEFFAIMQELASEAMPGNIEKELDRMAEDEGRFVDIESVHDYKIVFSLRKEYLSVFDYWTNDQFIVNELYRNRMYLLPMTWEQASRVITKQPNPYNHSLIETLVPVEKDILNKIDENNNNVVEPLMLSILCSRLFARAVELGKDPLTSADVEGFKMGKLISDFYDETVPKIVSDHNHLSQIEQQIIDENGHRNRIKSTQLLGGEFDVLYKQKLEDAHIIRIERYNGDDYVELIHDRLCEVIMIRKEHRKNREINRLRRLSKMNVLLPQGRELIDNELDYTYHFDNLNKDERWFLDDFIRMGISQGISMPKISVSQQNETRLSLLELLDDKRVQDASIRLEFVNKDGDLLHTSDGISCFDVSFDDHKRISEIIFRDKSNGKDESYRPVYIKGGFCGIRIDYEDGYEKRRTYLRWNGTKFCPTNTSDGYATVEFDKFDEFGMPGKTKFMDAQGNDCMHVAGNYGFFSDYNEDGYEEVRTFTDKQDQPLQILSGVCGRKMEYDNDTGFICKETNLDSDLQPIYDKHGYCIVVFEKDVEGRVLKEFYLDVDEHPHHCENGYAVEVTDYVELGGNKISFASYHDKLGNPTQHKDGYWMIRSEFDEYNHLVSITYLDKNGNPTIEHGSGNQKVQFSYDERHFIIGVKFFSKDGLFSSGYWFGYNDTYTHIRCMGGLTVDNKKCKPDNYESFTIELRDDVGDGTTPLLRVFMDENNKPVMCDGGYKAKRIWKEKKKWFDEESRDVREMYYDETGRQMPDRVGAYGTRYEYDEEEMIQIAYNLDKLGDDCEDSYGTCRYVMMMDCKGRPKRVLYYNLLNDRCANSDGVHEITCEYTDDGKTITTYRNAMGQPCDDKLGYAFTVVENDAKFTDKEFRSYHLDRNKAIVVDNDGYFIKMFAYDKRGETFEVKNIGPDGELLNNKAGYAVKRVEKSEDGLFSREMFFDEKRNPVVSSNDGYFMRETYRDAEGRLVKLYQYDEKSDKMNVNGVFGIAIEYRNEGNATMELYLDRNGALTNDADGVAKHLVERDGRGRKTKEVYYNLDDEAVITEDGDYGKIWKYDDNPDCLSQQELSINKFGKLMNNRYGYCIYEILFDENNNPIRERVFDTEMRPVLASIGVYEIVRHISFDDNHVKTIVSEFYDTVGESCIDNNGVAVQVRMYDSSEHVILELNKGIDGSLIPFGRDVFQIKREYATDNEYFECYLDENGDLSENGDGIAIKHKIIDNKGRVVFEMRYDANRQAVEDSWGDCGERMLYNDIEDYGLLIGLDADGKLHLNNEGIAYQRVRFDNGRVVRRTFLDFEMNQITNQNGVFGLDYEYIDDDTVKVTTLDADMNPCVPPSSIYASEIKTTDEYGRTTFLFWLDAEGNPVVNEDGDSGLRKSYAEDGSWVWITYLNKDRVPHDNRRGRAKQYIEYDDHGLEKLYLWFNTDGEPACDGDGNYGLMIDRETGIPNSYLIAWLGSDGKPRKSSEGWTYRMTISFDDSDNEEFRFFDEKMRPFADQDGDVAFMVEHDGTGTRTYVSLDAQGNPRNNNNGYARRTVLLDEMGRITKEMWFDNDGHPFCNKAGDYGFSIAFDDEQMCRTVISLDRDGNPHMNKYGYAKLRKLCDEKGRIVEEMCLDECEQITVNNDNGCCGYRAFYIDEKRLEIRVNIGADGEPCEDLMGCATCMTWKDNNNVIIRVLRYDKKGCLVPDKMDDLVLAHVEFDGQFRDNNLEGYFFLLNYNQWQLGIPTEVLGLEIMNGEDKEKDLRFIEVLGEGDDIQLGKIYQMRFSKGLLGVHFTEKQVSLDIYTEVFHHVLNPE